MAGYIVTVLLVLLVVSIAAAFVLVQSHLSKVQKLADNAMPELWEAEDGTYELSWHDLEETDSNVFFVDVSTYALGSGTEKETFFSGYINDYSIRLPALPTDEGLVLQIDLIKKRSVFGKESTWKQASIKRYFYIQNPEIRNLDWEVDSDAGTASVSFDFHGSNSCSIYVLDPNGGRNFLKIVDENTVDLNLNEEEALWIPTPGNPCTLSFVPGNRVNGMALYGGESKEMTVTWEDFAARDIHLSVEVLDGCICRLEWDKVDCDYYEIQMLNRDTGVWKSLKSLTREDDCTYVTPRLSPGAGYSFRVAAVLEDYVAVSEVQDCEIAVTPLYCTVWPVKDLKAYSDASKSESVGEVRALDAHCVIAVENGMFGVSVNGQVGYIDSNFCMINLPEYVGALCNYDITNSYDSIFMAHGFEIPGLTGNVIKGFEDVRLDDSSFLVPLLYPSAIKLETAIDTAREKGYRLKIYEAFRPHEASVYMYQKASEVQYTTLPESTYWGDEPGVVVTVRDTDENGNVIQRRKTYWELMNDSNNSFTLSAFVSAGISKHNLGVAMDLTLESLDTGYELTMQTDLHDLSQYSARVQNNEYAKELSRIMMSSGYNDLYSEWWHFQDDEIRAKLSLPCVNEGVTADCWMSNGFGWRYRDASGAYVTDCTLTIDGSEYTFDSDGYVQN
ncbi:MAG: D-alanyl-D-alanine carboxypeptidase family protein [bacterium]|nr:D-alanyl-D-alanine carboxypeptidase family protein [bacterium]